MVIETLVLGAIRTNCYFIMEEETKDTVVIDPADDGEQILEKITQMGGNLKGILLTHGHFDHIYGVREVKNRLDVPVYAGEAEKELLGNPMLNGSAMGDFNGAAREEALEADVWVKDGQILSFGSLVITVLSTPGHTKGSVCYVLKNEDLIFTGDTLFFESVGRTDFPTGNSQALLQSLQEKLFCLPEDTIVYPGHGRSTKIGYEKRNNPYANGDDLW